MDAEFTVRDDGQVDAELLSAGPLFNEALSDSVSSLPPRGARGNGPSTYWVDEVLNGLREAERAGSDRPFVWGNITLLRLKAGRVEARYDFDDEDDVGEFLDVTEFVELLGEWRVRILEQAAQATEPLPDTYRRNPAR